jgi:hypothetical protein
MPTSLTQLIFAPERLLLQMRVVDRAAAGNVGIGFDWWLAQSLRPKRCEDLRTHEADVDEHRYLLGPRHHAFLAQWCAWRACSSNANRAVRSRAAGSAAVAEAWPSWSVGRHGTRFWGGQPILGVHRGPPAWCGWALELPCLQRRTESASLAFAGEPEWERSTT